MYLIRQGSRVCLNTPAKVNIFLELHRRRSDGYHELETLMVPVDLYDRVSVEPNNDQRIDVECKWVDGTSPQHRTPLPVPSDNIAAKAVQRLCESAAITPAAKIRIIKRIPSEAGLGGGSSDAAAALLAANEALEIGWSRTELATLAAEIGSDVPYFMFGGLAKCTGRGEAITPLRSPGQLSFVIIKPNFGLATPRVFQHAIVPDVQRSSSPILAGLTTMNLAQIARGMFNRLQAAAEQLTPWIQTISSRMNDYSVLAHQLSGSGTSYFALCRSQLHARRVASKLRATKLGRVFVATTIGPGMAH